MKSNSSSPPSPMERLVSQKFALLARVGQAKRKASEFQTEAEFYFTCATEALAITEELLTFLRTAEQTAPAIKPFVAEYTSRQHQLIRNVLSFWPKDSASQERVLSLLDSDGVGKNLDITPEGFYSLSSEQMIKNVERILEASQDQRLNP